ncbi:MAG: hypothetical protein KFF73_12875 [Cyclobacteriaceae bacterium]|nr:hypothetical protein [Cyclobacteriaceae bacterium]
MTKRKYHKKNKKDNLKVNPQLPGFDIEINSFGEIHSNYKIDEINEFLDRNLEDKKLKDQPKEKKSNKKNPKKDRNA